MEDYQEDKHLISLYFILSLLSGIINALLLKHTHFGSTDTYFDKLPIVDKGSVTKMDNKFTLSLGSLIGITAILLFGLLSSFCRAMER